MEPLETPIKDGILYQQHVKFGKVGTLAAQQLPRALGLWPSLSPPRPGRMGKGVRVGDPTKVLGNRTEPHSQLEWVGLSRPL